MARSYVSTKELLERASMKPLSEEVKYRRWNMIGHILSQDRNNASNIATSWAPEGQNGEEQLKRNVKRQGGDHETGNEDDCSGQRTVKTSVKAYVPRGTRRIGNVANRLAKCCCCFNKNIITGND